MFVNIKQIKLLKNYGNERQVNTAVKIIEGGDVYDGSK